MFPSTNRSFRSALLIVTGFISVGMNAPLALAQACEGWGKVANEVPPSRGWHDMVFDSQRGVSVLFGGTYGSGEKRGDTWEWDGTQWLERIAPGPSPRGGHAMAYDSDRGVTVLFGQYFSGPGTPRETWEWDGEDWLRQSLNGPISRYSHRMAYDRARGVTVMFGGETYVTGGPEDLHADTWTWDGRVWEQVAEDGPSARRGHAMAYDSARDVIVLFGGHDGWNDLNDTWEWNGSAWTETAEIGPLPRHGGTMVFDEERNVTVLFGGWNGSSNLLNDTWEWNGVAWQPISFMGPSDRYQHAMSYDSARKRIVLQGGQVVQKRFDDTWEFECERRFLEIETQCPAGGRAVVRWSGLTPEGPVAILLSPDLGRFTIPAGFPCAGTMTSLQRQSLRVAWQGRSDSEGAGEFEAFVPRGVCSHSIQMIDLTTCRLTNVVTIE